MSKEQFSVGVLLSSCQKKKQLNVEGFTVTTKKNISKKSLNYGDFCYYSKEFAVLCGGQQAGHTETGQLWHKLFEKCKESCKDFFNSHNDMSH